MHSWYLPNESSSGLNWAGYKDVFVYWDDAAVVRIPDGNRPSFVVVFVQDTLKANRTSQILTTALFLRKVFFEISFQNSLLASRTLSKLVTGVTLCQQMLADA